MEMQTGNFRTQMIGGFDRRDVIRYIEQLAAQRNDFQSRAEALEKKNGEQALRVKSLEAELAAVRQELAEKTACIEVINDTVIRQQDETAQARMDAADEVVKAVTAAKNAVGTVSGSIDQKTADIVKRLEGLIVLAGSVSRDILPLKEELALVETAVDELRSLNEISDGEAEADG